MIYRLSAEHIYIMSCLQTNKDVSWRELLKDKKSCKGLFVGSKQIELFF